MCLSGSSDYGMVARLVEGNWLYLRMNHNDLAWCFGQHIGCLCLSWSQSSGNVPGDIFSSGHLEFFWFFTCFLKWKLIPGEITQMQIINLHDGPAHVGKTHRFLAVNLVEPTEKKRPLSSIGAQLLPSILSLHEPMLELCTGGGSGLRAIEHYTHFPNAS